MAGRLQTVLVLLASLAVGTTSPDARAASSSADVATILGQVIERAQKVAKDAEAPECVLRKLSLYETLATDGTVKNSKEKCYEVTVRRGMMHNRLLSVDGRPLPAEESAALSRNERQLRDAYTAGPANSPLDRMDQLLNERLFARFDFTDLGHRTLQGRDCVALRFKPKSTNLPSDRLIDRAINRLHGEIWVDHEEHEILRAEVHTEGTLRLWGGVLGTVEALRLEVGRDRTPTGVWYNRNTAITLRARRLFTPIHLRVREIVSDPRHRSLEPSQSVAGSPPAARDSGRLP